MGRNGISFDQVAVEAEVLTAEGFIPSAVSIREKLGTGSQSTIQRFLNEWRMKQPQVTPLPVEFNRNIVNVVNQEVAQAKAEVRAEVEKRLVIAQQESESLLEYCEALESERNRLRVENSALTECRDALTNDSQEKNAEY